MGNLSDSDITSLQGNILRGYRLGRVRQTVLEITNRAAARAFLAASVAGSNPDVPQITTEQKLAAGTPKPTTAFNLGFTFEGLRALGLAPDDLASFPTEFIQGMTRRAAKLGDFGDSAPANWPAPYHQPERIHVIASAYAADEAWLDKVRDQLAGAFRILGEHDGRALPNGEVFFGYRDGLSQPRFAGFHDAAPSSTHPERIEEPSDPLGTMLLNQPTRLPGLMFRVPSPAALGNLGTFNAFRVLKQDCFRFEDFLTRTAELLQRQGVAGRLVGAEHAKLVYPQMDGVAALREVIAAQFCGRWRDGTPMQLAEVRKDNPKVKFANDFDYGDGALCPVGAHIRRNNPRGGAIVQPIANFSRRLARRGMSYGPDIDLATRDDAERGLLGNFLGASLGAQFEAVVCDWLNLGLNSPEITGSNDPLLGANVPETSWFDLNLWQDDTRGKIEKHRIHGLPRFVTTRGGAYTFLPTVTGISYLAGLKR